MLRKYSEVLIEPVISESARFYLHDEPTLYPQFADLLSFSRELGLSPVPTLSTNGIGLAVRNDWEQMLDELKNSGVKGLNISLFGDLAYHDWFTGKTDSFSQAHIAAERAAAKGFWIHWNLHLTKQNSNEISNLASNMKEQKFHVYVPVYTPRWEKWGSIAATGTQKREISRKLRKLIDENLKTESEWIEICQSGVDLKEYLTHTESNPDHKSKSVYEFDNILYDDVVDYPQFKIGSVHDSSFRDIFSSTDKSEGMKAWESSSIAELAKQYGDPDSDKLDDLRRLWLKWFVKSGGLL